MLRCAVTLAVCDRTVPMLANYAVPRLLRTPPTNPLCLDWLQLVWHHIWPVEGSHRTCQPPRRNSIRCVSACIFVGFIYVLRAALFGPAPATEAVSSATAVMPIVVTIEALLTISLLVHLGDDVLRTPLSCVIRVKQRVAMRAGVRLTVVAASLEHNLAPRCGLVIKAHSIHSLVSHSKELSRILTSRYEERQLRCRHLLGKRVRLPSLHRWLFDQLAEEVFAGARRVPSLRCKSRW